MVLAVVEELTGEPEPNPSWGTKGGAVMKKSTKNAGLVVKASVKAGGPCWNHNRQVVATKNAGLVVKASVKAGGPCWNHNRQIVA
jgi:hypothetical protein